MMDDNPAQRIIDALEAETMTACHAHMSRRNMLILEAALASFLDTHTPGEVAAILRQQANILEAYE